MLNVAALHRDKFLVCVILCNTWTMAINPILILILILISLLVCVDCFSHPSVVVRRDLSQKAGQSVYVPTIKQRTNEMQVQTIREMNKGSKTEQNQTEKQAAKI